MSVSCKCPSAAELRELLEGRVADPEQTTLTSHLDQCSSCQQALEAMASGNESLAGTLLEQAAYKSPDASSAYWTALEKAQAALTTETPTLTAPAVANRSSDKALAFLDPPADSSHLGTLMNFQVVRVVGRGGMGIVLQAIDTCLQRDVAIKVLDPDLSKDEVAVKRFCREARAAAAISHENVVSVHYVERDETKDLPFLVMELITGESLEKKLEREGRLSLKEIVHIGMQTAAGLAAAHEKGLIHRDIKPGNILLEKSGQRVKLTDFGLARAAEDMRLTRSGLVAGTPLYMSPEQATGEELDVRSDLFSLGVVLYELAAGQPPFTGKTPLAVLKRVTDEKQASLRERDPDLPEWFSNLVDRLLAKKPEDRFQTAREVANTLEHFWALLKSSETVACPQKKPATPWKAVVLGTVAGLLTLGLGVAVALLLLPRTEKGEAKIPAPLHVLKGNAGALWSLAVARDGKTLAMGTDEGTVKLWDLAAEKVLWTLPAHKTPVWALAISPGGDLLATGSDDGRAVLWDVKTRSEAQVFATKAGVRAVAFDAEGAKLLTGDRNGSVRIWHVKTGEKLVDVPAHSGLVATVAYAPDGKSFASAGGDKTIKIWDAASGGLRLTLAGHASAPYGIAFAPDSRRLVSGAWDRTVRLWDLDSGNQLAKLEGHTQDVWSVDFEPAGTRVASAGEDHMVRIWDSETRKEITGFRGSDGAILHVRFVPEAGLIVAAGKDGDARIWRLADLNLGK